VVTDTYCFVIPLDERPPFRILCDRDPCVVW
jgi:hypothetical protein